MRARRLPVVDEYREGGRSAVFVGDTVVCLSELATAALAALGAGDLPGDADWTDTVTLEAALVDVLGAPPASTDTAELTRAALAELADLGLVDLRA